MWILVDSSTLSDTSTLLGFETFTSTIPETIHREPSKKIANLWNHHLRSLLSRSIQSLASGTSGTFQEIMNFQWLYNLNIPQERLKPSNPKAPEASIDLRNLRDLPPEPSGNAFPTAPARPRQPPTPEPIL